MEWWIVAWDDGLGGGRSSSNEPPLSGEVARLAVTEGFSLPLGEGGLRGLSEKVG